MRCPACQAEVPLPKDPLVRLVACPACRASVDLAAGAGDATERRTLPRTARPVDPMIGRDFAGGRYRIDGLLGVGGMGRVYTATQRGLGRSVALKVLSPELAGDEQFRRRFDREAGTLASLEHPHIVTVHDVGVEGDAPYIVMSLVVGPKGEPTTLRDVLDAGPIEEEWALRLVQQTCSALEYAHGRGVVHRDIKPANILIDREGRARIADFGIARVGGADRTHLTTTGSMLGTMRYMAPEQMADSAKADGRSDLYSLGVVLYEMLTGDAPVGRFEMPSETKKGLDARLDGIVDRALRRSVPQRYQSAAEMARDLSRITTEREYGRLVGTGAGAAASPGAAPGPRAAASAAPAAPAAPAASDAAPSSRANAPGASATATRTFVKGPPASDGRPAADARAPSRVPLAIGLGVVLAGVGAFFAFRGSGSDAGSKPAPPAAHPDPTNGPLVASPSGTTPPTPTPTPTPGPAPTPPKPVAVVPPPKPSDDDAPTPATPTPATDEPHGALAEEDAQAVAEAKAAILEAIGLRGVLLVEDLADEDDLPEIPGADTAGAIAATRASLELWSAGRGMAVAERMPQVVVPALAKALGSPEGSVRIKRAARYLGMPLASFSTGAAVAVGTDWALVSYEARGRKGRSGTGVAVCVREGGAWRVFL